MKFTAADYEAAETIARSHLDEIIGGKPVSAEQYEGALRALTQDVIKLNVPRLMRGSSIS